MKKRSWIRHLQAAALMTAAFILCRYVLFDLHGMKQWPELLFGFGICLLAISALAGGNVFPWSAALGYPIGFVLGWLLQTDGVDPGGGRTNNLWMIWTVAMLFVAALGLLLDLGRRKRTVKTEEQA